jgi:hypothetical protein
VFGLVLDAAGRPVAGAFVQVQALAAAHPVPELAVFSDDAGAYVWPLRPGRYLLEVSQTLGQGAAVAEVPPVGATRVDIILR